MTDYPMQLVLEAKDLRVPGQWSLDTIGNGVLTLAPSASSTLWVPFSLPKTTSVNKGYRIDSIQVAWTVSTGAVNPMTTSLTQYELLDNAADTVTTVTPNPDPTTFIPLATGTNNLDTFTVDVPAYDNTANPSRFQLNLGVTNSSANDQATVTIRGINVAFTQDLA